MKINENIKRFRIENDMTMEELAKKIGSTKQTIQRYESGEIKSIPYDKIERIANALSQSIATLMGFEDNNEKESGNLLGDVFTDPELMDHVEKLNKLSATNKQIVYNMIDALMKGDSSL